VEKKPPPPLPVRQLKPRQYPAVNPKMQKISSIQKKKGLKSFNNTTLWIFQQHIILKSKNQI